MIEPNEPAFSCQDSHNFRAYLGLTQLDYIAIMAMQGSLANPNCIENLELLEKDCYAMADAIIKASKQYQPK